jgi:hypothetical protein
LEAVTDSSIIAFLEKQLQDEEDAARRMQAVYPTPWDLYDRGWMVRIQAGEPGWRDVVRLEQKYAPEDLEWLAGAIEHVALQAPDQTIRRIESMRALIAEHVPGQDVCDAHDPIIRSLAAFYSGHERYRTEWSTT